MQYQQHATAFVRADLQFLQLALTGIMDLDQASEQGVVPREGLPKPRPAENGHRDDVGRGYLKQ